MAYQYDEMGNIIGEYESEEERKAREEAANAEVHKQEVKTYGDGTQTVTTTQELPAQPPAAAVQPTAAPMPQAAPVRAIAATPMQGQGGAISPEQMAYTQRMESGANPNIGYHYAPGAEGQRKSSAYGAYGMTAPAYADVQRANPAFAGRDITSLSPQEQQQAMQTYTGLNAQSLQRQGVEPSEANVRLAHFLGAKGAADYLNNGTISPAAAAANGGDEAARRIAQQRLLGGNAPASGAAQQATPVAPSIYPQAQPGEGVQVATGQGVQGTPSTVDQSMNALNAVQDNPIDLLKFRADTSHPEWLREWAGSQASDLMKQEIDKKKAEKQATALITGAATGDRKASNQIAQTLTSQDGSWLKMILLGFISPQMAGEEAIKLGFGNKTAPVTDQAGHTGLVQFNAKGDPLQGTKSNGEPMTREELYAYSSMGPATTAAHNMPAVHGAPVVNAKGENGLMIYDPRTRQSYVQVGNEKRSPAGWITMAQNPEAAQNKAAAQATGTFTGQGVAPAAPQVAGGPIAPGAMPQAGAAPMPQVGAAPMPQAGAAPMGAAIPPLQQAKINVAVNKQEQTAFTKDRDAIGVDAQAGQTIADTKKAQTAQLYANPEIMGLLTGTGAGSDALRNALLYGPEGADARHAALGVAIKKAGITDPRTVEALNNYDAQQGRINGALVRQNLPGIQRITQNEFNYAKDSVLAKVASSTPMAVMQNNSREQFIGDITRAKNDFVGANNIQTNNQLQQTWPKQQDMLYKQYATIDDARNKWISQQSNGAPVPTDSTDPTYKQYVNTVLHSFKVYPTPEYNPQTGGWNFGTAQAEKAAKLARMKATLGQ
jgi:hypothetical protein